MYLLSETVPWSVSSVMYPALVAPVVHSKSLVVPTESPVVLPESEVIHPESPVVRGHPEDLSSELDMTDDDLDYVPDSGDSSSEGVIICFFVLFF